ncbi:MAG: pilus assembly protein TadG-related protein [candidate division KSB1 bacterium]|nr:pilus assembly protein TadG-related protein [candidate division KSB1 bacterium]
MFTAFAMLSFLLFAAMATDIGYILVADKQLQGAVDAASLAGAAALLQGQTEARNAAIRYAALNTCAGQPVIITAEDVSFPTNTRIRVQARRTVNTFFLRLAGRPQKLLTAEATAEMFSIKGVTGMAPFCVPNGLWQNGDRVVLKSGAKGESGISPCWRYPVDFPPVNRGNPVTGASAYLNNLMYGTSSYVEIGDILQIEPGNMDGPTTKGVTEIIERDPQAVWSNGRVVNSAFPGYTSPRILIVPMYDPNRPPSGGRGNVQVNAIGAFFLEGMSGKGDVIGVFMNILANGTRNNGNNYSMLRKIVRIG